MRSDPILILFMRAPRFGAVKTRLARDIGKMAAWQFYRRNCADLMRRLGRDPRWLTVVAGHGRIHSGYAYGSGVPPLPVIGQGRGDLGARMARFLRLASSTGRPVILIGSDIPGVSASHIAEAADGVRRDGFVFGPSGDGGFWLVAVKPGRPLPPRFMKEVRWSSPYALEDTLSTLRPGDTVAEVSTLDDIDDGKGYAHYRACLKGRYGKLRDGK